MPGIRNANHASPRHQMRNEVCMKHSTVEEIISQFLEIISEARREGWVHESILIEARTTNGHGGRQMAWCTHRESGPADHNEAACHHRRKESFLHRQR